MLAQVRKNIEEFVHISDEEFELFVSKLEFKKYNKNEYIQKQGEICSQVIFLTKGCFRYFYNLDGNEKTGQFFFENSWYTDMESFISGDPSEHNIQVIEPSECYVMNKKNLNNLYDTSKTFERLGRLIIEQSFVRMKSKNKMLTNLNPEERYLELLQTRPKVVERISQIHIASYLGIKPESLSRIRKRIFKTNK